jgi:outer membrane protein
MNQIVVTHSRIIFVTVLLVASVLYAQTGTQAPKQLTLEDALQTALTNHPSLRSAEAGVQAAQALLTQARSNFLPMINFSAGGSHIDGYFVFNPSFPPRKQTYDSYNAVLQAQQVIFDFSKTFTRVSAEKYNLESYRSDYQSTREAVALNLHLTYFQMIEFLRIVAVDEQTVEQAALHLERAKGFHEVGKSPQFDVTRAEVDLANANVALIGARNQLEVARVQLQNAMGVPRNYEFSIVDTFKVEPFPMSLDSVLQTAMQQRSELRSARARIESSHALVRAARSQHLPALLATGNYSWNGFNFPLVSRWNAGLTLSFPIFQGFNIMAQVQQARANENAAQAAYDVLTQQVTLEVQQYYLNLKEAGERMLATQKLLEQARENLRLAEARYNSGVGSAIEITDARTVLGNSSITNIQALSDYNSSLIFLRWSMGMLLEN